MKILLSQLIGRGSMAWDLLKDLLKNRQRIDTDPQHGPMAI